MVSAPPRLAPGGPTSRAHRRRTAAAAGLAAAAVLGLAFPAGASPVAPSGAGSTTPSGAGSTTLSGDGRVVLLVHTSGDATDVAATARHADARSPLVNVRHTLAAEHAFSVEVPAGDRVAAEAALRATPGVTGVEDPVVRTFADVPGGTAGPDTTPVPDDEHYPSQAGYLAAVHAPAAWALTHGSSAVRIAVLDSGIDVGHPDLAGKVVGTYNAEAQSSEIPDDTGHGTFVAGIAAADTGNGTGIAGAGYDTDLLGVKIDSKFGLIPMDDEVAGINWAVAQHADIINLSLNGPVPSAAEEAAVENAIAAGVLVVAAAGNTAGSAKQYPAAYPGVVAVGATDPAAGARAAFSSYGDWVTLAAPGVGIWGTTSPTVLPSAGVTRGYGQADGTSFSAPLVAGAAALLKATNPALTAAQLRQALVASAAGYAGQRLGVGQVDFARALAALPPPRLTAVTGDRTTFYPVPDHYLDTFAPGVTLDRPGTLTLTVRSARGAVVRTLAARRAAGRTTLAWDGRDARGHLVGAGTYRWQYSFTDTAGHGTLAAVASVTVSGRRLVSRTAYLDHRAGSYRTAGGTASCASARRGSSSFRHGVRLRNACAPATGDFAYATYRFTVPGAVRYSRVALQLYGRSARRPSQLAVDLNRVDGGVDQPASVTVSRSGNRWYRLGSLPAGTHVNRSRYVYAHVVLTGRHSGANDFDLRDARLRITYTTLA